MFEQPLPHPPALRGLDELLDAAGVGLGVAVAGERVAAAGAFHQDVGPKQARVDAHAGHFRQVDADFVHREPGPLTADDGRIRDCDDGREQVVALGPAAGVEGFGGHQRASVAAAATAWGVMP